MFGLPCCSAPPATGPFRYTRPLLDWPITADKHNVNHSASSFQLFSFPTWSSSSSSSSFGATRAWFTACYNHNYPTKEEFRVKTAPWTNFGAFSRLRQTGAEAWLKIDSDFNQYDSSLSYGLACHFIFWLNNFFLPRARYVWFWRDRLSCDHFSLQHVRLALLMQVRSKVTRMMFIHKQSTATRSFASIFFFFLIFFKHFFFCFLIAVRKIRFDPILVLHFRFWFVWFVPAFSCSTCSITFDSIVFQLLLRPVLIARHDHHQCFFERGFHAIRRLQPHCSKTIFIDETQRNGFAFQIEQHLFHLRFQFYSLFRFRTAFGFAPLRLSFNLPFSNSAISCLTLLRHCRQAHAARRIYCSQKNAFWKIEFQFKASRTAFVLFLPFTLKKRKQNHSLIFICF